MDERLTGQCNAQTAAGATYPNCPDKLFQYHHQPFNYFANYAPGTASRAAYLRDEAEFMQLAQSSTASCALRPVSFVKPIGAENEHPGYASTPWGAPISSSSSSSSSGAHARRTR